MNSLIKFLLFVAVLPASAATVWSQTADPNANPPPTLAGCLGRMQELCSKHALDWNSFFDSAGDSIKTHYTERFAALELVGKDGLELRYKVRGTREAVSASADKQFSWNDQGTTVYQVSLKDLDEKKISWSKRLQHRSTSLDPAAKFAYVFVLTDDKTAKVKVWYEDAQDSYKINGVAQSDTDGGTYARPPPDRPSLVLNVSTVDDSRELAALLRTAIEIAKKQ